MWGDLEACSAHCLCKTGCVTVDHRAGGFRSHIPWREAGATSSKDNIHFAAVSPTCQYCADGRFLVGEKRLLHHRPTFGLDQSRKGGARGVRAFAARRPVRKGQYSKSYLHPNSFPNKWTLSMSCQPRF